MRLPCRLALELRADDLVDVEEAVLLEADLDERRLHPGQHVVDDAEVDVAGDRAAFRALEVDLGDPAVLEDGDALLADVDGDEQLALRGRERRALAAAPAAALCSRGARSAAAPSAAALGVRSAWRFGLGFAAVCLPRRPVLGLLTALPPRVPRRRFGLCDRFVGCRGRSSAGGSSGTSTRLERRPAAGACSRRLLPAEPGQRQKVLLVGARAQRRPTDGARARGWL